MCCFLQLRQHHVESLHKANLLSFELLELITHCILSVLHLAGDAIIVWNSLLTARQSRVDRVSGRNPGSDLVGLVAEVR